MTAEEAGKYRRKHRSLFFTLVGLMALYAGLAIYTALVKDASASLVAFYLVMGGYMMSQALASHREQRRAERYLQDQ